MNITKMLTRSSVALLAAFSASAFAGAPLVPDYTVHSASVKLDITAGIAGDIEKDSVGTNNMIDILGGNSDNNDHELALAVPCDVDVLDVEATFLFVYNKATEFPVVTTDFVFFDFDLFLSFH